MRGRDRRLPAGGAKCGREPGLHAPREYKNEGITPEVIEKTGAAFSRSGSLAGEELRFEIHNSADHSRERGGGKKEDFEKFGSSVDVAQNKHGYTLLRQTATKLKLFIYKGLGGP